MVVGSVLEGSAWSLGTMEAEVWAAHKEAHEKKIVM